MATKLTPEAAALAEQVRERITVAQRQRARARGG